MYHDGGNFSQECKVGLTFQNQLTENVLELDFGNGCTTELYT